MGGAQLSLDTVLELCENTQRRIVLVTLAAKQQAVSVSYLTRSIAIHEHDPSTSVSGETLRQIRIALHHVHLPKLDAVGVVDYDVKRKQVRPTATLDQPEPPLSTVLDAAFELEAAIDPDDAC